MRIRRLTLGLAVAAVVVVSAGAGAGVGHARPDATAAPAASQVGGNIILAHWASSPVETELLKQVIAQFQKKYPKIQVGAARSIRTRTRCWRSSRRGSRRTSSTSTRTCFPTGRSRACSSRSTAGSRRTTSARSRSSRAAERLQVQRQDVRLPEGLVAARDADQHAMLAKAGVQAAPTTWAKLTSAARSSRARTPFRAAGRSASRPAGRLLAFVYQNRGAFSGATRGRRPSTPAVRDAVNYYVGLIQSGLAGTPSSSASAGAARRSARRRPRSSSRGTGCCRT